MTVTHFVLIDFENIPDIDLALMAGHPVHVSLLIGKNQTKLGVPLVQQIHKLADQVKLIEVGASGRNALDLTLACYLGMAVNQSPKAEYHIVSGDKDFEPMIAHLRSQGYHVSRHASLASLPFLKPASKRPAQAALKVAAAPKPKKAPTPTATPTSGSAAPTRTDKLIASLANPTNPTRPTTLKRLQAFIKSQLGNGAGDEQVAAVVQQLQTQGAVSIEAAGKVHYHP